VRRVSTLARLTAPYKARTTLAIVSLLAATLTALAPPFLAKLAVDDGIRERDLGLLTVLVVLFVAAGFASLAASSAQTYFTGWTGERILADLRDKLFRHLQRLSLGFYERNRAGVIISRLTNDVDALDQLVTDGVTTLVQNTLILIGSAAVLFYLDWRLALATLSVMPAMALAPAIFRIRSSRAYRAVRERLGLVTATLAEDIAGMRVVQTFTRERSRRRNFEEVNAHYRVANQETVVNNGLYFPFVDFLSAAGVEVVSLASHGIATAAEVGGLDPDDALDFVISNDHPRAEAVLVPDTALHSADLIEPMEALLGKTVLTANQVSVWEGLRLAGRCQARPGPGTLFRSGASVVRSAFAAG
jgi:ATP-binding cassette subfamily B protein